MACVFPPTSTENAYSVSPPDAVMDSLSSWAFCCRLAKAMKQLVFLDYHPPVAGRIIIRLTGWQGA